MPSVCLGLTGGIATGKSTFGKLVASKVGGVLFCADACVRHLLDHDPEVAREIVAGIHPLAYRPDGSPDRAVMRESIFANPEKKKILEGILHPRVRRAWMSEAQHCRREGIAFIADIPLLYEVGVAGFFDAVIVVACSEGIRMERLLARPGIDEAIAKKMIASQWPTDTKVREAQHVVWNDGHLEALELQANFLARLFHARSG